jgi:hypothetical protein
LEFKKNPETNSGFLPAPEEGFSRRDHFVGTPNLVVNRVSYSIEYSKPILL